MAAIDSFERLMACFGTSQKLQDAQIPNPVREAFGLTICPSEKSSSELDLDSYHLIKLTQPRGKWFGWCTFNLLCDGPSGTGRCLQLQIEVLGAGKDWDLFDASWVIPGEDDSSGPSQREAAGAEVEQLLTSLIKNYAQTHTNR